MRACYFLPKLHNGLSHPRIWKVKCFPILYNRPTCDLKAQFIQFFHQFKICKGFRLVFFLDKLNDALLYALRANLASIGGVKRSRKQVLEEDVSIRCLRVFVTGYS